MIDLGFIQFPLEAVNVIVIVTALLLAASYVGFDIIAAIGGVIAVVYGIRIYLYQYEVVISRHTLGHYEAALLVIVGAFLIYRGTTSVFASNDVNTWK
jgi:hypothetical protein